MMRNPSRVTQKPVVCLLLVPPRRQSNVAKRQSARGPRLNFRRLSPAKRLSHSPAPWLTRQATLARVSLAPAS